VAVRDIFLSGDGNDSRDGRTWENRVRTFTRARQLSAAVVAPDRPCFVIGQFNMARAAQFAQRLGKGIGDFDVPDGWSMRAHNPDLPWHFTDLDVLNQTTDFVQVYRNGTSYNAATANCPNLTNNNGVPSGQATGIWVSTRDVADAGTPRFRIARVWRGGNPLTIGSVTAFPSAYDPYNEIWEARSFATLGRDGTHGWTQLTPTEVWPNKDPAPDLALPPPDGGRLFVFCPQGNPATVWGGVTVLAQMTAGAGVVGELGLLTIQQSNGWHVDETIKAIGGGLGPFKIRGGCTDGRFEARADVLSPYFPVVDLRAHGTGATRFDTFTAIEVSPRWDLRITGKPYYEIDVKHNTGESDALRIHASAQVNGLLVRGRTSVGGQLCYIRDPGHSAIGRPNPNEGVVLDGLVVERDFSVFIGGMQYQRAFGITGDKTSVRNCTLSGRIYGQRTPSQIIGNIRVIGAEFHYGQQIVPAAPDNVANYPSRFTDDVRPWANVHRDGKNRDCTGLVVAIDGVVEVRDCVFNAVHAPALRVNAGVIPAAGESCLVTNCTFINSAAPGSQQTAVLIDTRDGAAGATHMRDNVAIGYAEGGQWTTNGTDRNTVALEDLATAGPKIKENVGWVRQAFATCFG
jgi:hypothetical protein